MEFEPLEAVIAERDIREIALQFVDIAGVLHTLWVPPGDLRGIGEHGIHTDGSSLGKIVDVSRSDLKLVPDPATFAVLPEGLFPVPTARIACDIYHPDSDRPFELDVRRVLRDAIERARARLGASVRYQTASEIEYFLLERDESAGPNAGDGELKLIDRGGYLATPPADRGAELRIEIAEALRQVGMVVEKHHHEVPHGKSELNLRYDDALLAADRVYLVKFLIKLMAARAGLVASFMPKPFHGEYGAGLHTHLSLADGTTGANLFDEPGGAHGLSDTARAMLGGILEHARGLAGITNPSVNSYKRLVPGWEAPVNISWARYNRSVLVRLPPGSGRATRFEYRPTDGSCNFYLAYAALLAAGLDGIERELRPPEPVDEDIYAMSPEERARRRIDVLPGHLAEALDALEADGCLAECLGEGLFGPYLRMKRAEWRDYCVVVHRWERERYLDV